MPVSEVRAPSNEGWRPPPPQREILDPPLKSLGCRAQNNMWTFSMYDCFTIKNKIGLFAPNGL